MGILLAQVPSVESLLPPRGDAIYHGGYKEGDRGYERYAKPSSKNPNLMLVNAVSDDDGNIIMPGYYELALSDDREMLRLIQAGRVAATIPVFKIEEDKSQEETPQPNNARAQRKFNKEQKKKAKKTKKLIKQGKMLQEPEIYSNASIQYDKDGDYYLIKYERGRIRAWGAIK